MGEFIFSFNSAVIVGSMFNVFSGSLVSFKIFKGIKNLKNNKAFGDDQVVNEYMKTTSNQFVDIYEKLFNLV
jgi:hypothetical protein